jgi:hypothetical protein
MFDRFRHQARDKGKKQSDAAEQKINDRTGGKYEQQTDDAQQRIEDAGGMRRERPPEEP